jgi:hypothetical protein
MKAECLSLLIVVSCVTPTLGQKIEILLKDGSSRIESIKASSEKQLFIASGTLDYSQIESIKFDSENPSNKRLHEKLATAGVKVFVHDRMLIFDIDSINDEPSKGDKKIILVCSDSLETLYKGIGRHLSIRGYAIENSSGEFLTIKTALRATSKLNYNYFLNVIVVGNRVIITAHWRLNSNPLVRTQESGFFDWEFTNERIGTFTMTVNSIIYNDLMTSLADFKKRRIEFER